jgi:hypothetical protein
MLTSPLCAELPGSSHHPAAEAANETGSDLPDDFKIVLTGG